MKLVTRTKFLSCGIAVFDKRIEVPPFASSVHKCGVDADWNADVDVDLCLMCEADGQIPGGGIITNSGDSSGPYWLHVH